MILVLSYVAAESAWGPRGPHMSASSFFPLFSPFLFSLSSLALGRPAPGRGGRGGPAAGDVAAVAAATTTREQVRGVGGGEVCGALVAAKWAGLRGLVEGEVEERAGASGLGCGRTRVEGAGAWERRLGHLHGSGRNLYA